jgi:hypothetical protein
MSDALTEAAAEALELARPVPSAFIQGLGSSQTPASHGLRFSYSSNQLRYLTQFVNQAHSVCEWQRNIKIGEHVFPIVLEVNPSNDKTIHVRSWLLRDATLPPNAPAAFQDYIEIDPVEEGNDFFRRSYFFISRRDGCINPGTEGQIRELESKQGSWVYAGDSSGQLRYPVLTLVKNPLSVQAFNPALIEQLYVARTRSLTRTES